MYQLLFHGFLPSAGETIQQHAKVQNIVLVISVEKSPITFIQVVQKIVS